MIAVIILLLLTLLGACLQVRATLAEHTRQLEYQSRIIERITTLRSAVVYNSCRREFARQMASIGMTEHHIASMWGSIGSDPVLLGYWNLYWQRVVGLPREHAMVDCMMTWARYLSG